MSAYMIIKAKITKPDQFAEYTQVVPDIVKTYGGEYRVLGSAIEILEASNQTNDKRVVVISEWPSVEDARSFWNSAEYQQAIELRKGCGEFDVILVDGGG